jgi:hypothetical protein
LVALAAHGLLGLLVVMATLVSRCFYGFSMDYPLIEKGTLEVEFLPALVPSSVEGSMAEVWMWMMKD